MSSRTTQTGKSANKGRCKECGGFYFRLQWGGSSGCCQKCMGRQHQLLLAKASQEHEAAKCEYELKKTMGEKEKLELEKQINMIRFQDEEAKRKHERDMAEKKSRDQAEAQQHEREKIILETDKLRVTLQITEKEREENEAERNYKREEAEKRHQHEKETTAAKHTQEDKKREAERQERREERQEAERKRKHEIRMVANQQAMATEDHTRRLELEKNQLERAKYELERVNRLDEILSQSDQQQVSIIRDILVPEERHNGRVERVTYGHMVTW